MSDIPFCVYFLTRSKTFINLLDETEEYSDFDGFSFHVYRTKKNSWDFLNESLFLYEYISVFLNNLHIFGTIEQFSVYAYLDMQTFKICDFWHKFTTGINRTYYSHISSDDPISQTHFVIFLQWYSHINNRHESMSIEYNPTYQKVLNVQHFWTKLPYNRINIYCNLVTLVF